MYTYTGGDTDPPLQYVCMTIESRFAPPQDSCRNLLAVLVAPSTMTVWNADTGTKVSRFTFTESIHAFLFNPFKPDDLVCEFKGQS